MLLGRTEINLLQIFANDGSASPRAGWFTLSGDAGSLHVLLSFTAAMTPRARGYNGNGDDVDNDLQFVPVDAVMLRLYWDRMLLNRAWQGWISHHWTRTGLQSLITQFQMYSHATSRYIKNAFETWRSNTIVVFKQSAFVLSETHDAEAMGQGQEEEEEEDLQEGDQQQGYQQQEYQQEEYQHQDPDPDQDRHQDQDNDQKEGFHKSRSNSARRRRSSGYGYGYGRLGEQQKSNAARVSLEREERAEEERARRWCVRLSVCRFSLLSSIRLTLDMSV